MRARSLGPGGEARRLAGRASATRSGDREGRVVIDGIAEFATSAGDPRPSARVIARDAQGCWASRTPPRPAKRPRRRRARSSGTRAARSTTTRSSPAVGGQEGRVGCSGVGSRRRRSPPPPTGPPMGVPRRLRPCGDRERARGRRTPGTLGRAVRPVLCELHRGDRIRSKVCPLLGACQHVRSGAWTCSPTPRRATRRPGRERRQQQHASRFVLPGGRAHFGRAAPISASTGAGRTGRRASFSWPMVPGAVDDQRRVPGRGHGHGHRRRERRRGRGCESESVRSARRHQPRRRAGLAGWRRARRRAGAAEG